MEATSVTIILSFQSLHSLKGFVSQSNPPTPPLTFHFIHTGISITEDYIIKFQNRSHYVNTETQQQVHSLSLAITPLLLRSDIPPPPQLWAKKTLLFFFF